jgi:hypothetical protein
MSDRAEVQSVAVVAVEGEEPLLVLRVSAELACALGEKAHAAGTTLEQVLRKNRVRFEIIDAPLVERFAWCSSLFERPLNLPVDRVHIAVRAPNDRIGCEGCGRRIGPGKRRCSFCEHSNPRKL